MAKDKPIQDSEYEDLLREIEQTEEQLQEEELETEKRKAGGDTDYMHYARTKNAQSTRALKSEIKRFAFEQRDVDLDSVIDDRVLSDMVDTLAKDTNRCFEHLELAHSLVRSMLYGSVPPNMRHFRDKYPGAVKEHMGFLYTTTYCDPVYKLWITTDLPAVFEPGDEMAIIRSYPAKKLRSLDNHIGLYFRQSEKLRVVKTKIATSIVHNRIKTHMDLIKLDPTWWKVVYDIMTADKKIKR